MIGLRVLCTLENAAIQCTKPNYCTQISCVLTTGWLVVACMEVYTWYVCKQTWLINIPAVTREKCSRHHGEGSADTEGCGGSLCSDCNPVVPEHSRLWLLL